MKTRLTLQTSLALKPARIVIASWAADSTAVVGGVIAWGVGGRGAGAKREITHGVVAFGGGILIAAVAFALLPQGMAICAALNMLAAITSHPKPKPSSSTRNRKYWSTISYTSAG